MQSSLTPTRALQIERLAYETKINDMAERVEEAVRQQFCSTCEVSQLYRCIGFCPEAMAVIEKLLKVSCLEEAWKN